MTQKENFEKEKIYNISEASETSEAGEKDLSGEHPTVTEKNSRKKFGKKQLSTLLIIMGVVVCLIPFGGRLYTKYQEKQMYEQFLKDQEVITKGLEAADEAFNETAEPDTSGSDRPAAIAHISISKIKCSLNVLEGSGTKELRWGAGHVTGTAAPGYLGNCCIAGHRNYTFGSYFSRLGEVEVGDNIKLEAGGKIFNYKVYDIDVVKPSDVSVLMQGTGEKAILTLITCHPKGKNTQRLIVLAELPTIEALVPEGYVPTITANSEYVPDRNVTLEGEANSGGETGSSGKGSKGAAGGSNSSAGGSGDGSNGTESGSYNENGNIPAYDGSDVSNNSNTGSSESTEDGSKGEVNIPEDTAVPQ